MRPRAGRQALQLDPDFWEAHRNMGIVLARPSAMAEALRLAERAADLTGQQKRPHALACGQGRSVERCLQMSLSLILLR
jgi:hypothetical protein